MVPRPRSESSLLERARGLREAREYDALARELDVLAMHELLAEPELGVLLVFARRRLGRTREALELVRRLTPACRRRGNDRIFRERLNLEAMLRFERGEGVRARALWLELLQASSDASDAQFVAHATNNLGIVYTLQGPQEKALASYGRATAAYQRLGDRRGLAQAHHNTAMVYRELSFLREADAHFRDAISYGRADESWDVVGRAEHERAVLLFLRGDRRLARTTAQRALGRFEELNEPAGAGESHHVLGTLALGRAEWTDARRHLETALELARETSHALLEAETLEALAALAQVEEDDESAGDALRDEAAARFEALGAAPWGRRVRARTVALAARSVSPPRRGPHG